MKTKFFFIGLLVAFFAFSAQAANAPVDSSIEKQELAVADQADRIIVASSISIKVVERAVACTVKYEIDITFDDGTTTSLNGTVTASDCKAAIKAVKDLMSAME